MAAQFVQCFGQRSKWTDKDQQDVQSIDRQEDDNHA
jgi:hypothetical protein